MTVVAILWAITGGVLGLFGLMLLPAQLNGVGFMLLGIIAALLAVVSQLPKKTE